MLLVDTGSVSTCLNSSDKARLGINNSQLDQSTLDYTRGVGGTASYYLEPAMLMFTDDNRGRIFFGSEIFVSEDTEDNSVPGIPSLLGRDFLNRCRINLDIESNVVQWEPRNVSGGLILH